MAAGCFLLQDFSFYSKNEKFEDELRPLSSHSEGPELQLRLNGILSSGDEEHYIEDVSISDVRIDGVWDQNDTVVVSVLTEVAAKGHGIWYRLGAAEETYGRTHRPFLWLGGLSSLVLAFLQANAASGTQLRDFQVNFNAFIHQRYSKSAAFTKWFDEYRCTDFRKAVNANWSFLLQQAQRTDKILGKASVWGDCQGTRIPKRALKEENTSVIPQLLPVFEGSYFGGFLQPLEMVPSVQKKIEAREHELGFNLNRTESSQRQDTRRRRRVKVGDVVGIKHDGQGGWKPSEDLLAYILDVQPGEDGNQKLQVIWLYRPQDTTIDYAEYPFEGEVFFSDHCNCQGKGEVLVDHIIRWYGVDYPTIPTKRAPHSPYFIRQKYRTAEGDHSFATLTEGDFTCECRRRAAEQRPVPQPGQCYYWMDKKGQRIGEEPIERHALTPVVVLSVKGSQVVVRHLEKLGCLDMDKNTTTGTDKKTTTTTTGRVSTGQNDQSQKRRYAPNELAWTNKADWIPLEQLLVDRPCRLRYCTEGEIVRGEVPAPFNRGGCGDCWIVAMKRTNSGLVRLDKVPSSRGAIIESGDGSTSDVTSVPAPLKGLSVFSGGGNLDRGLEEGGAVVFETAVDLDNHAIHTQAANCSDPARFKAYYGSIDDFLVELAQGKPTEHHPDIGEVDFISCGSPCPPFSALQRDKRAPKACRQAALTTTFPTLLAMYRPRYAVMENVAGMAINPKKKEEQEEQEPSVLSQMIASIVALGYQVNQFLMDAWSHGSCQQRCRLIITVAAPGLVPMRKPGLTHSHPDKIHRKGLGKFPWDMEFGLRGQDFGVPFSHRTPQSAMEGLPPLNPVVAQICVPFPDHHMDHALTSSARELISHIPCTPPGQSLGKAFEKGLIPDHLKAFANRSEVKRAWSRIPADRLVPTLTTKCNPGNSRCSGLVHWKENRALTVEEALRVQGIPDTEVVTGSGQRQWKTIGNGVDRFVAVALGCELWKALARSSTDLVEGSSSSSYSSTSSLPSSSKMAKRSPRAVSGTRKRKERDSESPVVVAEPAKRRRVAREETRPEVESSVTERKKSAKNTTREGGRIEPEPVVNGEVGRTEPEPTVVNREEGQIEPEPLVGNREGGRTEPEPMEGLREGGRIEPEPIVVTREGGRKEPELKVGNREGGHYEPEPVEDDQEGGRTEPEPRGPIREGGHSEPEPRAPKVVIIKNKEERIPRIPAAGREGAQEGGVLIAGSLKRKARHPEVEPAAAEDDTRRFKKARQSRPLAEPSRAGPIAPPKRKERVFSQNPFRVARLQAGGDLTRPIYVDWVPRNPF